MLDYLLVMSVVNFEARFVRKALVTGSSGFVGFWVCKRAAE